MNDLFAPLADQNNQKRPLADRMRPSSFDEVVGQEHLLASGSILARAIITGNFPSIIFWGPPGCGKTTLARLIANHTSAKFVQISAISEATKELRIIFATAEQDHKMGKQTLLFVDEIHRFNRAQQDLFLPYIESGAIILIGATTENPSFELNNALLSRCSVLTLKPLDANALMRLMCIVETKLDTPLPIQEDAREMITNLAEGDGRYFLNLLEQIYAANSHLPLSQKALLELLQKRSPIYDKTQDGHYNALSAFHKSMRASDINAALYWAARMLEAGEDPATIIRRMVACSSEDVGMADPQALIQALAAKDAYEFLGMPEAQQCIAQAIVYIASAPKSNASYMAMHEARATAKKTGHLPPPKHAMNAPTKLMKEQGYKDGYIYDHSTPEGYSGLKYHPEDLSKPDFYKPVERGFEREIVKRMEYWNKIRK